MKTREETATAAMQAQPGMDARNPASPPPTPLPSRLLRHSSTPSASSKRTAAPHTRSSCTTIRISCCASAAGMTATIGFGDGTTCRACATLSARLAKIKLINITMPRGDVLHKLTSLAMEAPVRAIFASRVLLADRNLRWTDLYRFPGQEKPPASRTSSALGRSEDDLVASAASSSASLTLNFCLGSRRDKQAAAAAVCGQEEDAAAARHKAVVQAAPAVLTESQTITKKKFGGIAPKKPLFSKGLPETPKRSPEAETEEEDVELLGGLVGFVCCETVESGLTSAIGLLVLPA